MMKETITPVNEEAPESPLPTQQLPSVFSSHASWASKTNIFRSSHPPRAVAVTPPR